MALLGRTGAWWMRSADAAMGLADWLVAMDGVAPDGVAPDGVAMDGVAPEGVATDASTAGAMEAPAEDGLAWFWITGVWPALVMGWI